MSNQKGDDWNQAIRSFVSPLPPLEQSVEVDPGSRMLFDFKGSTWDNLGDEPVLVDRFGEVDGAHEKCFERKRVSQDKRTINATPWKLDFSEFILP